MKLRHPISAAASDTPSSSSSNRNHTMTRTRTNRPRQSAFTMVEIALCLAIIGFALAAIIGVLPIGMEAQKDNQQKTIINHEATYWMEAIRSGAQGLDELTNYVESITKTVTHYDANNQKIGGPDLYGYTYTNCFGLASPAEVITNGLRIIGLLSTPKYVSNASGFTSNYIVASVRALSGAAFEKAPQNNAIVKDLAFRYRLVSDVVPYANWDTNQAAMDTNYWQVARNMQANLHDVRLLFRWPLFTGGKIGNGRQVYRAETSGRIVRTNDAGAGPLYFFEPRAYVRVP